MTAQRPSGIGRNTSARSTTPSSMRISTSNSIRMPSRIVEAPAKATSLICSAPSEPTAHGRGRAHPCPLNGALTRPHQLALQRQRHVFSLAQTSARPCTLIPPLPRRLKDKLGAAKNEKISRLFFVRALQRRSLYSARVGIKKTIPQRPHPKPVCRARGLATRCHGG